MLVHPKKTQTMESSYTVTISSQDTSFYHSSTTTTTTVLDSPASSSDAQNGKKKRRYSYLTRSLLRTHHIERMNNNMNLKNLIMEYSIDPYDYDDEVLIDCTVLMFEYYDLFNTFSFSKDGCKQFMRSIRELYNPDNDFHNFKHAWAVSHTCFHILINGADMYLDKMDIWAVFIASICHDVRHPGNSNAFEHATKSPVYKAYGRPDEVCVLERYHATVTASVLSGDWCKDILLANVSSANRQRLLKQINFIIMGTDMSKHKNLVHEVHELYQLVHDTHNFHIEDLEARIAQNKVANLCNIHEDVSMEPQESEPVSRSASSAGKEDQSAKGAEGAPAEDVVQTTDDVSAGVSHTIVDNIESIDTVSETSSPSSSRHQVKKVHVHIHTEDKGGKSSRNEITTTTTTTEDGITTTTTKSSKSPPSGEGNLQSSASPDSDTEMSSPVQKIRKSISADEEADTCQLPRDVRDKLTRIIVHVADIGAQTTTLAVAHKWTFRCYAEFKHQAAMESNLGIVTSPFLHDLNNDTKIYASQFGFINDIVQPIWTNLVKLVPNLSFALQSLTANKEHYQRLLRSSCKEGSASSATTSATGSSQSSSSST